MRAIWTGSIGFGLVNIPVKMYSAVESSTLDLDMLDKKDHANIRFKRMNEKTGKEVAWENIVKGYLLNDKYVVLDKADFDKASPEKSTHIEITEFVNVEEIDSGYFEMPYYLEPDKTGARAYVLLHEALKRSKKGGIGTLVMHGRGHLCLIKAQEKLLVLNRIRFEQEIRDPAALKIPSARAKPAEVKMALDLVSRLTKKFDISRYKDDYSDKLMKLIRAKVKGKKIPVAPMKVVHSRAKDLMEQLKASLAAPTARRKAS